MKHGTDIFWTQRDYSGNAVRVIRTRTVGEPFDIERSAGGVVQCVRLAVNRLAKLDDISRNEPDAKQLAKQGRTDHSEVDSRTRNAGHAKTSGGVVASVPVRLEEIPSVQDLAGRDTGPAWNEASPAKEPKRTASSGTGSTERTATAVPVERINVLAIDFLNLLFRAFHAGKPTETHAVRSMFQTVANAIRFLKPAHVVFAMDGGHKLRSQLLPQYKAHRPPEDPALTVQKRLAEDALYICGFDMVRILDWEADDVLATLANQFTDIVIASCDKDLLSLTQNNRCRIYHPWGAGEFMDSETKLGIPAHQVTDFLALCGDTSDGIPGVKGIGPKTAVALLAEYDSLEAIIVAAKLGNIKGANGQKIAAQHKDALLCRQVVELNNRLPIKELTGFQPHPDWRMELQNMRLGSVAAIMESLQDQRFIAKKLPPSERVLSATNLQVEQGEERDSGLQDCPESARLTDHLPEEVEPSGAPEICEPNATADREALCGLLDSESYASVADNISVPPAAEKYAAAGFTEIRESPPPPGTTLVPKFFARWKDGSKWLIDPNTKRHTCFSDTPVTEWRIDSRGPVDLQTNAVRG